jgi:hypothetical protein
MDRWDATEHPTLQLARSTCARGRLRSATIASSACLSKELTITHIVSAMLTESHDRKPL